MESCTKSLVFLLILCRSEEGQPKRLPLERVSLQGTLLLREAVSAQLIEVTDWVVPPRNSEAV